MHGRNWFLAVLAAAALISAGAACSGGDDDKEEANRGGAGGTGGVGGNGGTGGDGGTTAYDPAVDCAPICAKMVECFNRGAEADCVAACAASTTSKNVLLSCGTCVADNQCQSMGSDCFDPGKPCTTGGFFDLTVKGSGFSSFEERTSSVALVEDGCTVAAQNSGMVAVGSFGIPFKGALKEGRPYRIDYFIDVDGNGACDPTDEAGTRDLGYAVNDVTVTLTPGAAGGEVCKAWNPGEECSVEGPTTDEAVCRALAECCESTNPAMEGVRKTCRAVAETGDPAQCQGPLDLYANTKGWCAPSVDCQKLAVCCGSSDFAELTVGCELAATSAGEAICTALLGSYTSAGYCK